MIAGTAAGAALTYLLVLGWDREADVDPVTGSASGPYESWQLVCCAVALGLLAAAGGRARQAWSSAAAISLGFTAAWSVGAATMTSEDADLWPVGAVLLAPSTFAPALLVALGVQRWTGGPRRH